MIATILLLGFSIVTIVALLILAVIAFKIAGDYQRKNGEDK